MCVSRSFDISLTPRSIYIDPANTEPPVHIVCFDLFDGKQRQELHTIWSDMCSITDYFDVFHEFINRESSIELKLKALDKIYKPRSSSPPTEKNILSYEELENDIVRKRIDASGRKNANSRNMMFLKELNIAERQLRIMACFCPTDIYLQTCKKRFLKMKSILDNDLKSKEASTKKKINNCVT